MRGSSGDGFDGSDGSSVWFEGSLHNAVDFWAGLQPEKIAFVDSTGSRSYSAMDALVGKTMESLTEFGIRTGNRIVAALPGGVDFAALLFATMRLGVNLIPLDMALTPLEVKNRLDIACPNLFLATRPDHAECAKAFGLSAVGAFVDSGLPTVFCFISARSQDRAPRNNDIVDQEVAPCPALTIFTSGTTGRPKGVLLSEDNLEHAVRSINLSLGCDREDVFLTSLPVSHVYGVNAGILLPMLAGGTSVIMPKFRADESLSAIEAHGVTVYNGVPSMYKRMAAVQTEHPHDLSCLRVGSIAGAKCSDLEAYKQVLNIDARVIYGATECPIVAMTCEGDPLDVDVSGVGKFNPTVDARIVDDAGKLLAVGEEGEIICRGPGTMLGYLDDPEATRERIDEDGWVHTGDIGYLDEDGYVHIAGRKTDVINRGGYKVYPAEIEEVYGKNPAVVDCCVIGLPHEDLGQQIILFAAVAGAAADPLELRYYAKDKIAKYKLPDRVIVLERIPYLANGKPDKLAMMRMLGF